jgi:hypothetical protein
VLYDLTVNFPGVPLSRKCAFQNRPPLILYLCQMLISNLNVGRSSRCGASYSRALSGRHHPDCPPQEQHCQFELARIQVLRAPPVLVRSQLCAPSRRTARPAHEIAMHLSVQMNHDSCSQPFRTSINAKAMALLCANHTTVADLRSTAHSAPLMGERRQLSKALKHSQVQRNMGAYWLQFKTCACLYVHLV